MTPETDRYRGDSFAHHVDEEREQYSSSLLDENARCDDGILTGGNSEHCNEAITNADEILAARNEQVPSGSISNEVQHVQPEEETEKPISWNQLPEKSQLLILVLARLSEPITQTSLQAYLFYQLRSFDPSLPDSVISRQAGIFQGSFTAAQFLTSIWWGRAADLPWIGRKRILLIGLIGTMISCVGFGFSRSFTSAITFRVLGGLMNSNVGVMRTMISEIIVEKK